MHKKTHTYPPLNAPCVFIVDCLYPAECRLVSWPPKGQGMSEGGYSSQRDSTWCACDLTLCHLPGSVWFGRARCASWEHPGRAKEGSPAWSAFRTRSSVTTVTRCSAYNGQPTWRAGSRPMSHDPWSSQKVLLCLPTCVFFFHGLETPFFITAVTVTCRHKEDCIFATAPPLSGPHLHLQSCPCLPAIVYEFACVPLHTYIQELYWSLLRLVDLVERSALRTTTATTKTSLLLARLSIAIVVGAYFVMCLLAMSAATGKTLCMGG